MIHTSIRPLLTTALACLLSAVSTPALADELVELPRDLEVELALSALPADLQDGATIYVRDREKGFVVYRQGSNDWSTFVARTSVRFYDAQWAYTYPADQLILIAFDDVGVEHHIAPYFDIECMRIGGVSAAEGVQFSRCRPLDRPSQRTIRAIFPPRHSG